MDCVDFVGDTASYVQSLGEAGPRGAAPGNDGASCSTEAAAGRNMRHCCCFGLLAGAFYFFRSFLLLFGTSPRAEAPTDEPVAEEAVAGSFDVHVAVVGAVPSEDEECTDGDPFSVLGIEPAATDSEIKAAYRARSLQSHPDKNPGDSGACVEFQRVHDAYVKLSDPDIRQAYASMTEAFRKIHKGLRAYSLRPRPSSLVSVYTAVFDTLSGKSSEAAVEEFERFLRSEVSRRVQRMAECLRHRPVGPADSWMERVLSELRMIRNGLYCLQSGFNYAARYRHFSPEEALENAIRETGINDLSHRFWASIRAAVQVDGSCCSAVRKLVAVWSRCGCPVTPLRVPIPLVDNCVEGAVRSAFVVLPTMLSVNRKFHIHCFPTLLVSISDFLSLEDVYRVFGLNRRHRMLGDPVRNAIEAHSSRD